MRTRLNPFARSAFCMLGLVLFCAPSASAARLLQARIEQDGEAIVHTNYQDGGLADAATVWRYLKNPPIMVDEETTRVEPDANNPLSATLEGDIVVSIYHGDPPIAQARLTSLLLRRTGEETQAWFLPASEVERAARIAGLGPPTVPPRTGGGLGLWPAISALALLLLVGLLILAVFLLCYRLM